MADRAAGAPCGAKTCAPPLAARAVVAWASVSFIVGAALLYSVLSPPAILMLWNATPSSIVGLYSIASDPARIGDTVAAWPPGPARRLAAARHYLPARVPLVKRVVATHGDRVCARQNRILVNGRLAALRRERDPSGRPMPWWSGCERLRQGELFLLTPDKPDAFDGRYFGVTRRREIVGKATLLWAKPARGSSDG
jgi:conjugative transfer signal peptidase TraF